MVVPPGDFDVVQRFRCIPSFNRRLSGRDDAIICAPRAFAKRLQGRVVWVQCDNDECRKTRHLVMVGIARLDPVAHAALALENTGDLQWENASKYNRAH
jgi:hypothetical protein